MYHSISFKVAFAFILRDPKNQEAHPHWCLTQVSVRNTKLQEELLFHVGLVDMFKLDSALRWIHVHPYPVDSQHNKRYYPLDSDLSEGHYTLNYRS